MAEAATNGRPLAVVIPINEYEALEETAEILSDDDTLAAIRRGLDDLAAGDEIALDEVRQEMANREQASWPGSGSSRSITEVRLRCSRRDDERQAQ